MVQTSNGTRSAEETRLRAEIAGLIRSHLVDPKISRLWNCYHDPELLLIALEVHLKNHPYDAESTSRLYEKLGHLVTANTVSTTIPEWIQHAILLKADYKAEIWIVHGREGKGKTRTARGMAKRLNELLGWTSTETIGQPADILLIDDVRFFNKRAWQGKKGEKFLTFLRTIRGVYTLAIFTAPHLDDLDKALRESQLVELIRIIKPGLALWRHVIQVEPAEPQNEAWRLEEAERLGKMLLED